jgi:hypothetical protein
LAWVTTVTELKAIAAAAMNKRIQDAHRHRNAKRVVDKRSDQVLAHIAHRRASSGIVARLISTAVMIHIRLPFINVTSLASMATSVPVPVAKPTSGCAKKRTN